MHRPWGKGAPVARGYAGEHDSYDRPNPSAHVGSTRGRRSCCFVA
jgi:hypothetical protein